MFKLESVSKRYTFGKQTVHALQDVSLEIGKGDVYGIIGLSGAGKSTLIRCLSRLAEPTSGNIIFHGQNLAHLDKHALRDFRKNIGMIFQHFNLLSSRTVARNIAYPLEIIGMPIDQQNTRVDELLSLVGLQGKKESYPSQLSGGEKQRVGIARALANYPEVLFCDEATSALDPRTTREILSLLKGINKQFGVTIVLITHEMEVIKQICNKVAVIENGKIIEDGLVADIFTEPQHLTTKQLLMTGSHEIPPAFLKAASPNRKLIIIRYRGEVANQPIISEIIRKFNVEANIFLGWIDRLRDLSVGTLGIELTGSPQGINDALNYFTDKNVLYEVIENGNQ